MITAWLIYDDEGAKRNADYIALHKEIGISQGISFVLKRAEDLLQNIPNEHPDFAIVRAICPTLSKRLEEDGILIFNPAFVSEICNDKGKTIEYVAEKTEVPVIPTERFAAGELTESLLAAHPDSVVKAVDGHGGTQVFRSEKAIAEIRRGLGDSDFIIQPFIKCGGRDVRVYVIGKEIVGAVERTSPDGFKSNYSQGGAVCLYSLTEREKNFVRQICEVFSFGMVGIDFIIDETGAFVLNEIEDVVGARMLYACCPEIDLLGKYFSYIRSVLAD